jgi:hypothetical protein
MIVEEESAARALADVDWPAVLPELHRCGTRWLRACGWLRRGTAAGPTEAQELVNAAIDSLLSGKRTWPRDSPMEMLVNILCQTMRSIATNTVTSSHVGRRGEAVLERQIDDASSPEAVVAAKRLLGRIEAELADDVELRALFGAIEEGHVKREDLSVALGWPVEKVDVTRRRLSRRLQSKQLSPRSDEAEVAPSNVRLH